MNPGLSRYRLWAGIGWLILLAVIVLSLVRVDQPVALEHADKVLHLLVYGSLMYWWGMVHAAKLRFWMAALPLLGLALEWAQMLTAYRSMDWMDAAANLLGVVLARLLLATPAKHLLARIDRKLADRLDSRGP